MAPYTDSQFLSSTHRAPTEGAAQRVIDLQSTLERFGYDGELFREMVQLFRVDVPFQMERLEFASANHQADQAMLAAHSLRGLAANFGARRAMQDAAEAELAANRQEWAALLIALREMRRSFEEVLTTLEAYASEA